MIRHKNHKILGNYCWDCHKVTAVGVPGWPKASKDDSSHIHSMPTSVVWADTSEDIGRECTHCLSLNCNNPVLDIFISSLGDGYGEIGINENE